MDRIYLDTSVFGGYFDNEFEDWTRILFDKIIQGNFIILYSKLTDAELSNAPERVKNLLLQIPEKQIEVIEISEEAKELANRYVAEKVVGKSSMADCLHIALATIYDADVLVSWNFKHIVNLARIRGYNSINYRLGHKILEIRTPREILDHEN
jgi:predicted nucleic acid-binding protein